ncbi:hypothetical protein HD806DRAFT_235445 [Xylariaceae sp. AK1471]|nr:hypothetical protein HD806DRAFT_235445 [Xylariaceae sp. AK1471]
MSASALRIPAEKILRIQDWVQSILDTTDNSFDAIPDLSASESPTKRRRQEELDGVNKTFEHPFDALFTMADTPPATISSTPSRKRSTRDTDDFIETTPRPIKPSLPLRPFLSPSKRQRSNSPTKKRNAKPILESLKKPVLIKKPSSQSLPEDVKVLYTYIRKASQKQEVIPHEVRNQVLALADDAPPSFSYTEEEKVTIRAESVFDALLDIISDAEESADCDYHESGWNHAVHSPLLRLVYMWRRQRIPRDPNRYAQPLQLTGARVVNVMSATIEGSYIPLKLGMASSTSEDVANYEDSLACSVSVASSTSSTGTREGSFSLSQVHSRSDSKKVDYVLALDPGDDTDLMKMFSVFIPRESIERNKLHHVNQTIYRPLRYSPIACSIETKITAPQQDPILQLGIWAAAWYQRMPTLRQYIFSKFQDLPEQEPERIPSTLLIQVINHKWQLYFVCDRTSWIDLYGPLDIGSAEDILDAYALIATLEAIKEWMQTTFLKSLEKYFACDEILPRIQHLLDQSHAFDDEV